MCVYEYMYINLSVCICLRICAGICICFRMCLSQNVSVYTIFHASRDTSSVLEISVLCVPAWFFGVCSIYAPVRGVSALCHRYIIV